MTKMRDLFDEEPAPNSQADLGYTPPREPKPWNPEHPEHPSHRPENALQPGEEPPTSWNVARCLGIQDMRTFLTWCDKNKIDRAGHTVGSLYVNLNAHNREGFRYLCQALKHSKLGTLPSAEALHRCMSSRRRALLYSDPEPETEP